jgi:hypothetical protein
VTIGAVIARQRVEDLDAAIEFYQRLIGEKASPFAFAGLSLAAVGPFLLFSGPEEAATRLAGGRSAPRPHWRRSPDEPASVPRPCTGTSAADRPF